ncbi:MAG: mechanosensitive ion channel family protein [Flavipsychrobacter sp.]|nr:mechanosensitive ion channel family protein [Flavipsychrobacter sp.]
MPMLRANILLTVLANEEIKRAYDRIFDWLFTVGPRIVLSAFMLFFGLWIIRIIRKKVTRRMGQKNVHSSLRPFIESVVFTALHVALIFLVMEILGIKLTLFAAVIAAFGAAVGLALSGTLQNFASGVLILLLKPFKTGDNIIAQSLEGTVTSIQIFYTVVTTFDNRTVIMPNSKLSNEVIINITLNGSRRVDIKLDFTYKQDFKKIKELLSKAFAGFTEVQADPAFRIGIAAFEAETYTIVCNLWIKAHGFEDQRMAINEKVLAILQGAGIEIGKD